MGSCLWPPAEPARSGLDDRDGIGRDWWIVVVVNALFC